MPVYTLAQRRAWSSFLRALVGRYGPTGSFWKLHPELPKEPIRTWQIWNEENDHRFAEASVRDYVGLLRGSAPAIRSVDPDARILLGGLYATPRIEPALDATTFSPASMTTRASRASSMESPFTPTRSTQG